MIQILSWNIQSGLGCDNVNDLDRISRYIKAIGSPEIICLQEISRNITDYSAPGQKDQLDYLNNQFPEYTSHWGTGTSWLNRDGKREEFGNLTLCRMPVKLNRVHLLPRPPAGNKAQLQRVAVEIITSTGNKMLRVINTHLAYHVHQERRSQLEYLCNYQQWEEEACKSGPVNKGGAYSHYIHAASTILCGDFNFTPESDDYIYFTGQGWQDAWKLTNPDKYQPPTCGIFDHDIWLEGAHCRDYFWSDDDRF